MPQKFAFPGKVFAIVSVLASIASSAAADPFVAKVRYADQYTKVIAQHRSADDRQNYIEEIDPLRFTLDVAPEGTLNVVLNRKWSPRHNSYFESFDTKRPDSQRPILLRGYALGSRNGSEGRERIPVAATLFDTGGNRMKGRLFFGSHRRAAAMYTVDFTVVSGAVRGVVRVHRARKYSRPADWCGSAPASTADSTGALTLGVAPATRSVTAKALKIIEISTEADTDWFTTYSNSSNAEIQSILNSVETIYEAQLNLTFDLVSQNVVTDGSRYTSANVETLLDSFKDFTNTNQQLGTADLYHLFTGKDTFLLQGSTQNFNVIGLAYTGVVCQFPDFAYGLTEDFTESLNAVTTAHEIGHNFNAEHDADGTIMGTQLNSNNPPTQFSSNSRSQISSFVSANGSCLSSQGGGVTPNPPPTGSLAVSSTSTLSSDGTANFAVDISGNTQSCTITVRGAAKKAQVLTRGRVITTYSTDEAHTSFRSLVKRKTAARDANGKAIKIFVSALYDCGSDGVGSTKIVGLNAAKVKVRKKVSPATWLTLLAKGVEFSD